MIVQDRIYTDRVTHYYHWIQGEPEKLLSPFCMLRRPYWCCSTRPRSKLPAKHRAAMDTCGDEAINIKAQDAADIADIIGRLLDPRQHNDNVHDQKKKSLFWLFFFTAAAYT